MNPNTRLILLAVMALLVAAMWALSFLSKRMDHVTEGIEALAPHEYESLTIVTLGTGETFENHRRRGPSVAIGTGTDLLLVDAGRGVAESLRAAGIPVSQPQALLLSSLRPENTVGLDDLWLGGWLAGREQPLAVYGPVGTRALVDALREAHRGGAEVEARQWGLDAAPRALPTTELSGGERFSIGALDVRAGALPGGPIETLAFRVGPDPKSVVLGGAGYGTDAWLAFAEGAGTWVAGVIHGASLDAALEADLRVDPIGEQEQSALQREAAGRLRLEDVGALAKRAGIRSIILTRLRPPPVFESVYESEVSSVFRGPVFVAEDAEAFTP